MLMHCFTATGIAIKCSSIHLQILLAHAARQILDVCSCGGGGRRSIVGVGSGGRGGFFLAVAILAAGIFPGGLVGLH